MLQGLKGKVAFVTGAAQGIGSAIAQALATEGADVAIVDLPRTDSSHTLASVTKLGVRGLILDADISKPNQVDAAVERTFKHFGRIDILVNNAGIGSKRRPLVDLSDSDWSDTLAVNLNGPFYCCRAVGRVMRGQRSGVMVNVASYAALMPAKERGDYCVSKAGVAMLTRVLALEMAPHGVRVNAVAPELVQTPLSKSSWGDAVWMKQRKATHPMGRVGQPDEIARVVAFLASDAASYINGAVIPVTGGPS